jgi:transcriptional regulator with XRE-family HTH domain
MKFAEYCNTTASYIGHIETGKKFPSMEMIEKMASALRIKPYHLFIDRTENISHTGIENTYPKLPESMKNEIKEQIDLSVSASINEIFNKY